MKIVVTGGAGFIGSHVVEMFIAAGHEVTIIDNLSSGKKNQLHPQARFYEMDIRSPEIFNVFQKEAFEVVNHHAAQISVRHSVEDPKRDAEINILGLVNILTSAQKIGVKKIIFASSGGAIYGDAAVLPTPEDYFPLNPLSPYGISKLSGEFYLQYYQAVYGIPYSVLRYANVYGPRQDPHGEAGVIAIFSQKFLSDQQPIINGSGNQERDFIFVKDVARANLKALSLKEPAILNIGTGKATSINTIFALLKSLTGSHFDEIHAPPKPGEQQRSALDTRKARDILEWQPSFDLEYGLKETVEYFRSQ